jgi:hypothetical protein
MLRTLDYTTTLRPAVKATEQSPVFITTMRGWLRGPRQLWLARFNGCEDVAFAVATADHRAQKGPPALTR